MKSPNRIFFPGSPWPEGHAIVQLKWTGRIEADGLYFDLHLQSADYYAERDVEGDVDELDSWKAPAVWGNYHACHLSSTKWGPQAGIFVGDEDDPLDWSALSEWVFDVDMHTSPRDHDDHAFHIYLLGHDSVLRHSIRFVEPRGLKHRLVWEARVALTYAGDYELKHRLEVDADVTFLGFRASKADEPEQLLELYTTDDVDYVERDGVFLPAV